MKILGISVSKTKKRALRTDLSSDKFRDLIEKNNLDDALIKIYRVIKTKGSYQDVRFLADITLDNYDADSMDHFLLDNYGPGNYKVTVNRMNENGSTRYVGSLQYALGEQVEVDTENLKDQVFTQYSKLMEKVVTKAFEGNPNEANKVVMDEITKRALADPVDTMMKQMQLLEMIAQRTTPQSPAIESDPLANLLSSVVSLAPLFLNRNANNAPVNVSLPGHSAAAPLGAIPQHTQIPKEFLDEIKLYIDNKIAGNGHNGNGNKPDYSSSFETIFLSPLKNPDLSTEALAEKIFLMLSYTSELPEEQIHPCLKILIEGITLADTQKMQEGYIELCKFIAMAEDKIPLVQELLVQTIIASRQNIKDNEIEEAT